MTEWLWQTNERSADYSFNRSHAACYALIAYRTAWLKANHPAEYMAALISSVMATKDKVPFFVARCEEMGIEILPPDVNESDHEFVVVGGQHPLRPGRRQGRRATLRWRRSSAPARSAGAFTSLWDFCARVDCRTVNKKSIEALVKCGAFDFSGASRRGMLSVLEAAQARRPEGAERPADRPGLDLRPRAAEGRPAHAWPRPSHPPIPSEEFDSAELLAVEKESLGLFVSAHPLKAGARRPGASGWTARWASWPAAATATGSAWAGSSPRPSASAPRRATR